jgi:hypothetical protein
LVQGFLEVCRAAGYAEITIYGQRTILHAFLRWASGAEFATMDLGEYHLDSYLTGEPDSKPIKLRRFVIREFLAYLHQGTNGPGGKQRSIEPFPSEILLQRYIEYLVDERGLTAQSVHIYKPFVKDAIEGLTLASASPRPGDWGAEVKDCLTCWRRVRSWSNHQLSLAI